MYFPIQHSILQEKKRGKPQKAYLFKLYNITCKSQIISCDAGTNHQDPEEQVSLALELTQYNQKHCHKRQ